MKTEKKSLRLIVLVASTRLSDKALDLYEDEELPIIYRAHAYGTGRNEMEDLFGLGSIEKRMLVSVATKKQAEKMLRDLRRKLKLGDPNTGIAFTIALDGVSAILLNMIDYTKKEDEEEEVHMNQEQDYSMVVAVVNDGYSEEVMNAARSAGAGGGTVLHSRRIGNEKIMSLLGFSVQDKKEIVFILTKQKKKADLMEAISKNCGISSEANGIVLSMPLESVMGID